MHKIVLASASPRRRELLAQIHITPLIHIADIDETPKTNESPQDYVQRLATEKVSACIQKYSPQLPVLAADTAVVLEGKILGKPQDQHDAKAMLHALSGRTHRVFTAIALQGKHAHQALSVTQVTFKQLLEADIQAYCLSQEPYDKAGSYAIQGLGSIFIEHIEGSFSGVMGLPLFETAQLLRLEGIELLA